MAVMPRMVADPGGDVFTPGDPPHGVCWSPTDPALEEDPTWVRLDDPAGIRIATGFQIVRGRSSETDRTATGAATVTFQDTEGILDPTNPSSPFWDDDTNDTLVNPMKQAAIALQNPVTGDWHTLFRGFLAGPDHALDMYTETRGLDQISWSLVDAFDVFANVILTPGKHGDPLPSLTAFPNVYYAGTTHVPEEDTTFVHVDDRIVHLLDDAGWPGTGLASSTLRNIFSGNVSVQGVMYSRKDSLLSALFDACDAEFPGGGFRRSSSRKQGS